MRKRVAVASVASVVLAAVLLGTPAFAAASVPIGGDLFQGVFEIQSFAVRNIGGTNTLAAIGKLTGVLQTLAGPVNVAVGNIAIPVGNIDVTNCEILHLELGPLDLDLLGLVVHLDQVVLDISAEPGPGNLLGNLLCAITGLLDSPGTQLSQLVNLLNRLLAILG